MRLTWLTKHTAFWGLLGATLPFGSVALAGSVTGATITQVSAESSAGSAGTNDVFFVWLNVAATGSPACATQTSRFTIDPTTNLGKAMIAIVLEAKATSSTIDIQGGGACSTWHDTENIFFIVAH